MKELQLYNEWVTNAVEDSDVIDELRKISGNNDEIYERFYRELEFGTGGIRGIIGAGITRMNIYTIRKTTAGLAITLNEKATSVCEGQSPNEEPPIESCDHLSVAISYDSRNKSYLFAKEAAKTLAAYNIKSYLFPELMPTPVLSFAVRSLKCAAGIMVTASHNPAKYNGYKCYGADGCQMTDNDANRVLANINKLDIFKDVNVTDFDQALKNGLIEYVDNKLIDDFYTNVIKQSINPDVIAKTDLKAVYTPLNGAGNVPVRTVLERMGLKNINIVAEQEKPDPNFTTCPFPNPEITEALALGLRDCKKLGADLLLATDPDCDRVGIAVKYDNNDYKLITGNEVGALLLNYICEQRTKAGTMPKNPLTVKTIVTTNLVEKIAQQYNVEMLNVLTGFKYIGEKIGQLEEKGEEERYIFGFEESYGYLAGTHARDKDAVVAAMLITEMAAFYHQNAISLYQKLQELYKKHGYYLHTQSNFVCEGASGMQKMAELMAQLRNSPPESIGGLKVIYRADYKKRVWEDISTGKSGDLTLPKSDVLVYKLENNCEVVIRPSGTEPKIKAYYTALATSHDIASEIENKIKTDFTKILGV